MESVKRTSELNFPIVSINDAANYLRVDSTAEVGELDSLVYMATEECERYTGRALVSATYRLIMDDWPLAYPYDAGSRQYTAQMSLPRTPLVSVESVQYYDENNALQTFSASNYVVVAYDDMPGKIALKQDVSWPALYKRPDAVQINFTAGYGTNAYLVPAAIKRAALLLCRHHYAGGNPNTYTTPMTDEQTAYNLLNGYRVAGWTA